MDLALSCLRCFMAMRQYTDHQQHQKELQDRAEGFRRETLSSMVFYHWWSACKLSQDLRLMERIVSVLLILIFFLTAVCAGCSPSWGCGQENRSYPMAVRLPYQTTTVYAWGTDSIAPILQYEPSHSTWHQVTTGTMYWTEHTHSGTSFGKREYWGLLHVVTKLVWYLFIQRASTASGYCA